MAGKWHLVASLLLVALTSADPILNEYRDPFWERDADLRGLRVVEAPVTANRIADVMINTLVDFFAHKTWNLQKTLPSVSGSVPFKTDSGQQAITVKISNGVYKNLGSIRRAKSADIDETKHIMSGSLGFEGLEFKGDYSLTSPAVGQAPAASAAGTFSTTALKYFVDYEFLVDTNGLPVAIKSWMPRAGQLQFNGATNLAGNKYEPIFKSVLQDAAKSLLDRVITNDLFNIVKNQIVGKMQLQA